MEKIQIEYGESVSGGKADRRTAPVKLSARRTTFWMILIRARRPQNDGTGRFSWQYKQRRLKLRWDPVNQNSWGRTFIKRREKTNHFAWALAVVMVETLSQSFHHNAPLTLINFIPHSFNPVMLRHTHTHTNTHKHMRERGMHDHVNTQKTGARTEREARF